GLLLAVYPTDHRRAYGQHMAQVFRDVCRDAFAQQGTCGVLAAWLPVLFDLTITALEEHRRKGIRMSKSTFIRLSGLIVILGGAMHMITAIGALSPTPCPNCSGVYLVAMLTFPFWPIPIAIGLAGVYARFAPRINWLGKLGLIFAIVGGPAFVITFLLAIAGIIN